MQKRLSGFQPRICIRLLTLALSSLEEERKAARVAALSCWRSHAKHVPSRFPEKKQAAASRFYFTLASDYLGADSAAPSISMA
jgi:hypothetical protein